MEQEGMTVNNRAKAMAMVSNHCQLECMNLHGKGCSNACFYNMMNKVEQELNKRELELTKEGGGEDA